MKFSLIVKVSAATLAIVLIGLAIFLLSPQSNTSGVTDTPVLTGEVEQSPQNISSSISPEHARQVSENADKIPLWLASLIFVLIIACLISTLTSLFLYRRRIRITNEQALLVPENLLLALGEQTASITSVKDSLREAMISLNTKLKSSDKSASEIAETLIHFQKALLERDNEISRYKTGYDIFIYKKFLLRFLSVYQSLKKLTAESNENASQLQSMTLYFEDAFEECGVEIFYPETGINFLENNHLFEENTKNKSIDDPDRDYEVHEIIRPGLRSIQNSEEIFVRARAVILRYGAE